MCYLGEEGDEVLYGTTDGKIGLVQISRYFMLIDIFVTIPSMILS